MLVSNVILMRNAEKLLVNVKLLLGRMNALFLWSLDHVSLTLIGWNERLVDCYRFRLSSLALIGGTRFLDLLRGH